MGLCSFLAFPAFADEGEATDVSTNDYGGIGLLQTRTARFAKDGQYEIGASYVNPHRRYYMNWQILPWLEVVFRYSDVRNAANGLISKPMSEKEFWSEIVHLRNNRSYLDRSFDFKFKLWDEGKYRPALALGLQDAIGTGVWASEYIVASKRYEDVDFTLGMGWGYMGSRGSLPNPMRLFGSGFGVRNSDFGLGGKLSTGTYFRGRKTSLFGGIEYRTPIQGLNLKLEYDGANPKTLDRGGLDTKSRTPFNVGMRYRANDLFDVTLGVERGTSVMLHLAMRADLYGLGLKKRARAFPENFSRGVVDDQALDVVARPEADLQALRSILQDKGYDVKAMDRVADQLMIVLGAGGHAVRASDRLAIVQEMFDGSDASLLKVTLSHPTLSGEYITRTMHRDDAKMEARIGAAFNLASKNNMSLTSLSVHESRLTVNAEGGDVPVSDRDAMAIQLAGDVSQVTLSVNGTPVVDEASILLEARSAANTLFDGLESKNASATAISIHDNTMTVVSDSEQTKTTAQPLSPAMAREGDVVYVAHENDSDAAHLKKITESVYREMSAYGFLVGGMELKGNEAVVYLLNAPYGQKPKNIGRAAAVAARYVPADVEYITVAEVVSGIEVNRVRVLRADLERHDRGAGSPEEAYFNADFLQPQTPSQGRKQGYELPGMYPSKGWWITPALTQHVGDPEEGIYRANVDAEFGAVFSPLRGLNFTFIGRRTLFGTLDGLSRKSDSVLPHVRSDIVEYSQAGKSAIYRLQADYVTNFKPDWYGRIAVGLLEQMYGGVGAEVLYKPFGEKWGASVNMNWVRQRGYKQQFGFRNYKVVTGHATAYYDLPFYDMRAVVSVGRYLAKDIGTTIDISRRFKNGVRVGGFATFTNVSAAEFGEGSFDKGFYISVPMELFLDRTTRQTATYSFRPLTRDGGQKLGVGPSMYDVLDGSSPYQIANDWAFLYD